MKTSNPLQIFTLLFFSMLFLTACPCDDPALVEIPGSDASGPELVWYVIEETSGSGGVASSLVMYTDAVNNINVSRNSTIKVQLVAKDDQSGVKRVATTGGFGLTCTGTPTGVSSHGLLGELVHDMSGLTVCGLRELKLSEQYVDVGMPCPSIDYSFSSLQFNMNGEATNNLNVSTTSVLNLNVVE